MIKFATPGSEQKLPTPSPEIRKLSERRELTSSSQLLSPEVAAVEIGKLKAGQYETIKGKMATEATKLGISNPLMVVDLIFEEGKTSELGSSGQPYPIAEDEWEEFVLDVQKYCGDNTPKVYMVDGDKFEATT